MKNPILGVSLFLGALLIGSCSKTERVEKAQIGKQCNGKICSISIQDLQVDRFTNLIGKSIDRVVSRTALQAPKDNITWTIPNSTFATSEELNKAFQSNPNILPCTDSVCTANSNPTGVIFNNLGVQEIAVIGTIVNADGSTTEIDQQITTDISIGKPLVSYSRDNPDGDLSYTFTADFNNTGIPSNATLSWSFSDGSDPESGTISDQDTATTSHIFPTAGQTYQVTLLIQADDIDDITVTQNVDTGAVAPTINEPEINGKKITLSANLDNTGLPAGSSFSWSALDINRNTVATGTGQSGVVLQLPDYNTAYSIKLIATRSDSGTSFTTTKEVTTDFGTPTIDASSADGSSRYTLTANLDNTGIPTDSSTFKWTVDNQEIGNTQSIEHNFLNSGEHTINLVITPPNSQVINASPITVNIGEINLPNITHSISSNNHLEVNLATDLTNTGLDDGNWTLTWDFGDNSEPVVINNPTAAALTQKHVFLTANSTFNITLTATQTGANNRVVAHTVTTNFGTPTVTATPIDDSNLNYTLKANLDDTGIVTNNATFQWTIDGAPIGNTPTIDHNFTTVGTHKVNLIVTPNDSNPITIPQFNISIEAAGTPTISHTISAENHLEANLTANLADTGLDDGTWTLTWDFSDGITETVNNPTQTTISTQHEFDTANKTFVVMLTATKTGSTTVVSSHEVTTNFGTPTITNTLISGFGGTKYTITANLDNTGIATNDATFKWTVNGQDIGNTISVEHNFLNTGTYSLGLTVTPANSDPIISPETIITIDNINLPNISYSFGSDPLTTTLSASLDNTGLNDGSWILTWNFDDGSAPVVINNPTETALTQEHTFILTNKAHDVTLTASKINANDRIVTQNITTNTVNPPAELNISSTAQTDTGFDFIATLPFTNTGITSQWSFTAEASNPDGSVATGNVNISETQASVTVNFPFATSGTYQGNITIKATPPNGSGDSQQSVLGNLTVGTKPLPKFMEFETLNTDKSGIAMQTIIDGLNSNSNSAHATFSIVSSTSSGTKWMMSCNSSYVVKPDSNGSFNAPASNASITHNDSRGIAAVVLTHTHTNPSNVELLAENSSYYSQNAYHFAAAGVTFIAGCWSE